MLKLKIVKYLKNLGFLSIHFTINAFSLVYGKRRSKRLSYSLINQIIIFFYQHFLKVVVKAVIIIIVFFIFNLIITTIEITITYL